MEGVKIIRLPKLKDKRGSLTFFENENQIPFKIKRSYWIYDVPEAQNIESHAFRKTKEFIIALSGSFDVILNDGNKEKKYHLNKSNNGLYIPNMIWRHLENFSKNSVSLIVSSRSYDQSDYIRDYQKFKLTINEEK